MSQTDILMLAWAVACVPFIVIFAVEGHRAHKRNKEDGVYERLKERR